MRTSAMSPGGQPIEAHHEVCLPIRGDLDRDIRQTLDAFAYSGSVDPVRRYTDPELGRLGCALAIWNLLKEALYCVSPDNLYLKAVKFENDSGGKVTSADEIIVFYENNALGGIERKIPLSRFDASAVPAGSIVIGHKKDGTSRHVLIGVDIEGRWDKLYAVRYQTINGAYVFAGRQYVGTLEGFSPDGIADAFVGNTGLNFDEAEGRPHLRVQEFATTHEGLLAKLNTHHGAINEPGPLQPYASFTVLTFNRNPMDLTK